MLIRLGGVTHVHALIHLDAEVSRRMGGVVVTGRVVGGGMENCSEKPTGAERDTVTGGGKVTERGQTTMVGSVVGKEVGAADDLARSLGVGMRSVGCQGIIEGIGTARVTTGTTEKDVDRALNIQTTTVPPHRVKRRPGDSRKICTLPVPIEVGHRTGMARKVRITWRVDACKGRLLPSVSGHPHLKGLRGNCLR